MDHGKRTSIYRLIITAAFFAVLSTSYLCAQESETIPIPLYIDEVYSGEISATILPDDSVQIRPSELIAYLSDLMTEEAIETAGRIFPASGWLDLTEMGGLGVRIVFKFEDLTIHITIPAHLRRETEISLTGTAKEPSGTWIEPAEFSAFMNLDFWNQFNYEDLNYNFALTPELGLNIFSWVVEAKGGFRSGSDPLFLDYGRVVKDFEELGYRLEVGDLTIPVSDLSGISSLLGASFRRNTELSDTPAALPYTKEIFLREPSRVEVYLNGVRIRQKDLQSGSYIFKDFQLARGVNRLVIKWEDSEGPHEEELVVPYEASLLLQGESDLGIAVGLPDRSIVLPTVTSYQYLGITDNFTFGITESLDIDGMIFFIRPDFLLSTDFGAFSLVPIWGMNFSNGMEIDATLGYQLMNSSREDYLNLGTELSYDFNSISDPAAPVSLLSAEAFFSFLLEGGFSFTPEIYWGYNFTEQRHLLSGKAVFKQSIRGGSALTANLGINYDEEVSFSATISYSTSFPEVNQNLYVMQNLENQKLSGFWNKYASADEEDISLSASAEVPIQLDEKLALGLQGGYEHSLFNVSASHSFNMFIESAEIYNTTTLRGASGLVLADGIFSITRPINDSFIIIAPEKAEDSGRLLVNAGSSGSELVIGDEAGIMPGISSYTTKKIYIEPEEIEPGMNESDMRYLFRPTYKSAAVIVPKAEVLIYIGGTLLNADKEPMKMLLGRLTGKNTGNSIDFFTDENGYFEAYNLKQDVWTLELMGTGEKKEIDLRASESGFTDAGTFTFGEAD